MVGGQQSARSVVDLAGTFRLPDGAGLLRHSEPASSSMKQFLAVNGVGGLSPGSKDLAGARAMVRDGIGGVLDHARSAGVPLAIEPLHPMYCADRACVNTLGQALDLCDELDSSGTEALGVVVDAYHVWWDPSLKSQIERAAHKRLL